MKFARIASIACLILLASSAAFASPLFGTWKGDLNGQPITIVVSNVDRHVEGKVLFAGVSKVSAAATRELQMTNASIVDAPPTTLRFQVPNQNGSGKIVPSGGNEVTFELRWITSEEGMLRITDPNVNMAPIKVTKQK